MKRKKGEREGEVGGGKEVGIALMIKRLNLDHEETETSWQRDGPEVLGVRVRKSSSGQSTAFLRVARLEDIPRALWVQAHQDSRPWSQGLMVQGP